MSDIVRQTITYRDPRQSQILNAHNKDNYGRHRGIVLYGMTVSAASATTLTIGAGAIYSPFGTKVFVDLAPGAGNTISVSSALLSTPLSARPYVLAVVAAFAKTGGGAFSPAAPQAIDSRAAFTAASPTITFTVRNVAYRRDIGTPTMKLAALDPIGMVTSQDDSYSFTTEKPAVSNTGGTSLANNEVLLAYVVMGVDPSTGNKADTLTSPGVSVVQSKNLLEGLSDLIGADPVFGRNVIATEQYPAGAALTQAPTTGPNSNTVAMAAPHYGAPDDETTWSTYKHPNFLRDGDSLLDSLRRLDYVLRLWMDRTGDQDLINKVQDGATAGLPVRASLDQILDKFSGGSLTGTNANALTWEVPADSTNVVLKEGAALHAVATVPSAASSGDTHKSAIAALNRATWHMLKDILGISLTAAELRQDVAIDKALNATLRWVDEQAIATAASVTNGGVVPALSTEAVYPAIVELAKRTRYGTGDNLVEDRHGLFTTYPTVPSADKGWSLSAGTTLTTRTDASAAGWNGLCSSQFSIPANGYIQCLIQAAFGSTPIRNKILAGEPIGVALLYSYTDNSLPMSLEVTLEYAPNKVITVPLEQTVYDGTSQYKIARAFITAPTALAANSLSNIYVRVKNTTGATRNFYFADLAVGFGPQSVSFTDRANQQSLRCDGKRPWTADQNANGKKLTSLADGTVAADAVNKGQLDAVNAALTSAKVSKAGDTMTGALDMGANLVSSSAVPTADAHLVNKLYVANQLITVPYVTYQAAIITASGTFTIPHAKYFQLILVGGGGGGGSGGAEDGGYNNTLGGGGGGGGSGQVVATRVINAVASPADIVLTITIGAGGQGASFATPTTNGVNGGNTVVSMTEAGGITITALGGFGGGGGQFGGSGGAGGYGGAARGDDIAGLLSADSASIAFGSPRIRYANGMGGSGSHGGGDQSSTLVPRGDNGILANGAFQLSGSDDSHAGGIGGSILIPYFGAMGPAATTHNGKRVFLGGLGGNGVGFGVQTRNNGLPGDLGAGGGGGSGSGYGTDSQGSGGNGGSGFVIVVY